MTSWDGGSAASGKTILAAGDRREHAAVMKRLGDLAKWIENYKGDR